MVEWTSWTLLPSCITGCATGLKNLGIMVRREVGLGVVVCRKVGLGVVVRREVGLGVVVRREVGLGVWLG
jgi:hypothetical protein